MVKEPLWRDMPNDLHKQQGLLFPNEILQQIMSQVCQEVQSGVNSYLGCACKWVSRKSIAGEYYGQACPAIVFSQILFLHLHGHVRVFSTNMVMNFLCTWLFIAYGILIHFCNVFRLHFFCVSSACFMYFSCVPYASLMHFLCAF